MQIYLHQTHHTIADFDEIFSYIKELSNKDSFKGNIHLFPELFLCGYPLKDLCWQRDFISNYLGLLERIKEYFKDVDLEETALLLGGLNYEFKDGIPSKIENIVFELSSNKLLEPIYTKRLLPSYDIFDESKYFTPGDSSVIWEFEQKRFAILICEDMWYSTHYPVDPVKDTYDMAKDIQLNGVFNFSASPWHIGKEQSRIHRAKEISDAFNCPFYYLNKVGSEDEIIFDGASFIIKDSKITHKGLGFKEDIINSKVQDSSAPHKDKSFDNQSNSLEGLFTPRIENGRIMPLTEPQMEEILHALNLGIGDYARKCSMNKFLVALSGGMDSALVLALVRLFLKDGQEVEAVYMPSQYSATLSYDICVELCQNLGVKLTNFPIKFLHSSVRNQFEQSFSQMEGLTDENIQSRLRGALIYARSNQTGAMVLNTSNKSELAVGYSTLYGDSVGALSPIGDLYKTEVFDLARYINKKFGNLIPESVITRPPSAELREGQEDSQSLPPYEILDTILEGHLSYRLSEKDIVELGIDSKDVSRVLRMINIAEYKRYQFCPILKLKSKSFGFGRRIPICKKN